MNRQPKKGGRNPKADPATSRYSVNFTSQEHIRFLKMYDRSGMTSKSAFIKAQFFGETFHVMTFETKQFSCTVSHGGKQLQPDFERTEKPFFRAQGNGTDLQTGEVYAAARGDSIENFGID